MEKNIKNECVYMHVYKKDVYAYIHVQLNHFAIQQKLPQNCESNILELRKV